VGPDHDRFVGKYPCTWQDAKQIPDPIYTDLKPEGTKPIRDPGAPFQVLIGKRQSLNSRVFACRIPLVGSHPRLPVHCGSDQPCLVVVLGVSQFSNQGQLDKAAQQSVGIQLEGHVVFTVGICADECRRSRTKMHIEGSRFQFAEGRKRTMCGRVH